MGVTIKGRVFNSEIYNTFENGISNVWILLKTPNEIIYKCKTDTGGEYLFNDLIEHGIYRVYEIVYENNKSLENLPQPKGYIYSTSKRMLSINIKQSEVNNNLILESNNFSHGTKVFNNNFLEENIVVEKNGDVFSINMSLGTLNFERNLAVKDDIILYGKSQKEIYTIDMQWNINFLSFNKDKFKIGNIDSDMKVSESLFHIGLDKNLYVLNNDEKKFMSYGLDMSRANYCIEVEKNKSLVKNLINKPNLRLFVYNILDGNIYGLTEKNDFIKKIDLSTGEVIALESLGNIHFESISSMFSDELGHIYLLDTKNNNIFKGRISINSISINSMKRGESEENGFQEKNIESLKKEQEIIAGGNKKFSEEYIDVNTGNMISGCVDEFEEISEFLIDENVKNGCININTTNGMWVYIPNKNFEGIDYFILKLILSEYVLYKKIFLNVKSGKGERNFIRNNQDISDDIEDEHIEFKKSAIKFIADKTMTTSGDIINFEIFIKNTSNFTLENLKIKNLNSKGSKFCSDKILLNGKEENIDISIYGARIPRLEVKNDLYIKYNVKILNIENDFLEFIPKLEYEYNEGKCSERDFYFEGIRIQNIMPNIKIEKITDKNTVIEGDRIKNTIIISNIGKINIKNLKIQEIIDKNLDYVGDLKIDGVSSNLSLVEGIKIQELLVEDNLTINFYTKVVDYKIEISSYTTLEHEYVVNEKTFNSYIESEITKIKVLKSEIKIEKSISKKKLIVGENFEYYIDIINQGEISLKDGLIKWGFANNIEIIEIRIDEDIINFSNTEYLELPILYPSEKIRVRLLAKVNRLLKSVVKDYIFLKGEIINKDSTLNKNVEYEDISESFIEIYNPSLKLIKSISDEYTIVKEELEAKILIINDGDIELQETIITDILPKELEFIKGSVIVDNLECENESIMSGVVINTISPGEGVEVKYRFKVIDIQGGQHFVKNRASANYLYSINEINRQGGIVYSNECALNIEKNKLNISKTWDKDFAVLGDEIEFKVIIQNLGTLDAINVLFVDELLDGLELVNRSFSMDGENVNNVNIERGIILGNVCIGEVKKIVYKVKILKVKNLLEYNTKTYIKYGYILENGKTGSLVKYVKNNNEKKLNLAFSNFNIVEKDNILKVYDPKPKIKVIDNIKSEVEIYNSYIIETSRSQSIEGKILTGYKLMVYGILKQTVEYTALDSDDEIYSIIYEIPFYDAIVLPVGFDVSSKIEPYGRIEKNIYKKLSEDEIYTSNTILLLAKILSV